jgi:chromosome segregation ATPase
LSDSRSALSALTASTQHSAGQLNNALERIAGLESELSNSDRQGHTVLNRRDSLQSENVVLLASLEEVRGKVVSLSNEQVALTDRYEGVNRALRERETELRSAGVARAQAEKRISELEITTSDYTTLVNEKLQLEEAVQAAELNALDAEDQLRAAQGIVNEHRRNIAQMEDTLAIARRDAGIASAARDELLLQSTSTSTTLDGSMIADLQASLVALTNANAESSTNIESLTEATRQSSTTILQLQQDLAAAISAHQLSLEELEQHQSNPTSNNHSESESSALIATLESTLLSKDSELASLTSQLSETQEQSSQLNQFLTTATEETIATREKLSAEINFLQEEITILKTSYATIMEREESTTVELKRYEQLVEKRGGEIDLLKAALGNMSNDLSNARGAVVELEKELEMMRESAEMKERKILELEETIGNQGLGNPVSTTSPSFAELESLSAQLEYFKGQSGELQLATSVVQEELRSKVQELENQRLEMNNMIEFMRTSRIETDQVFARANDLDGQNYELNETVAQLQSQIDSLAAPELRQQATNGEEPTIAEMEHLKQVIEELEQQLSSITEQSTLSLEQVITLSQTVETNAKEVESLRSMLEGNRVESEEASRSLIEMKEVLARTESKLAGKEEEIIELSLRPTITATPTSTDQLPTAISNDAYDREYVDGIQQQHGADLADARTQIRKLEERILAAESKGHTLVRENQVLQSNLVDAIEARDLEKEKRRSKETELGSSSSAPSHRPTTIPARSGSATTPTSPPAITRTNSNPRVFHRRASSHMPSSSENVAPGTATGFPLTSVSDQQLRTQPSPPTAMQGSVPRRLLPSTRHARETSLGLLKTRMDEEGVVAGRDSNGRRTAVMNDELMECSCCSGDLFIV